MMLQISIASRIMLLSGNVDLLLLVVAACGLQERVPAAWIWGAVASLLAGLVSDFPENPLFRKELLRVSRLAHPNQPARPN